MRKILTIVALTVVALPAFAQDGAVSSQAGLLGLASALTIAIAAFGGALGQGKAAQAALDGIARNPAAQGKLFVPMIIGLALIESLVIYAFVIAFMLLGKF
jgi:F-type H+-transporting ATPase subunit c